MFEIRYGDSYIFDPYDDDSRVSDIKISGSLNTCSYLDFTMGPTHPLYNVIQKKDLSHKVRAYLDGDLMFSGYVYDNGEDMDLMKSMSCKGDLSYLGDTRIRPYSTIQGEASLTAPHTVDGYFRWMIEQHNEHCDPTKTFEIGTNEGDQLDKNNYIYRASEQYPATDQEIQDKILDSLGGYLFVTYSSAGKRTISLLAECEDVNAQVIDFGENIVDFTKTETTEELYTAIIPVGGTPENEDPDSTAEMKPVTVASLPDGPYVNDGNYIIDGDRIYHKDAVERYGIRELYWNESDTTSPSVLAEGAVKTLGGHIEPKMSIEIRAIDLAIVRGNSKPLMPGQLVRVRSRPHDFDSYLLVSNFSFDVDNPDSSTYTLGTTYNSLTGESNKKINELNKNINKSLDSVASLDSETKKNAQTIQEVGKNVSGAVDTANDAMSKAEDAAGKVDDAVDKATEAIEKAEAALKSSVEEFYQSDSPDYLSGGEWLPDNTWIDGKYTFRRTIMTYGDGTVVYSPNQNGICISGNTGDPGAPGEPGPEGPPGEQGEKGMNGTMLYGNSSTASDDAAKVAEVADFELEAGATVSIAFEHSNTAVSPTLDINDTGAKPIITNGVNQSYWSDGQTVIFVYDGVNYNVASSPVYADTVTVGNAAQNNVFIDHDSVDIREGDKTLATFTPSMVKIGDVDGEALIDLNGKSLLISSGFTESEWEPGTMVRKVELDLGGAYNEINFPKSGKIHAANQIDLILTNPAGGGEAPTELAKLAMTYNGRYPMFGLQVENDMISIGSHGHGFMQGREGFGTVFNNSIGVWGTNKNINQICDTINALKVPSSDNYSVIARSYDIDHHRFSEFGTKQRASDGQVGSYISSYAYANSSTSYSNSFFTLVTKNNVKSYSVSDQAAFRTAIHVLNTVLANPNGWYMSNTQTATLSDKISNQATGVVLEWSVYTPSTGVAEDYGYTYTFVPKAQVTARPGRGMCCEMKSADGTIAGHKYIYISDTQITGAAVNTQTNNNRFVLRRVIGV